MPLIEKTRECPSCALEIDANADVCPYCGYDLPRENQSWKIVAVIVAILLIWPIVRLIQLLF